MSSTGDGRVTRTNRGWVAVLTGTSVGFALVANAAVQALAYVRQDPHFALPPGAAGPADLWVGVLVALSALVVSALLASWGALREPEVSEVDGVVSVRLGWRTAFETHLWAGVVPALLAFQVWWVAAASSGVTLVSVIVTILGLLGGAAALIVLGRRRTRIDSLVVHGDTIEAGEHRLSRSAVGSTHWAGLHGRDLVIERTDGAPPIVLSMIGNRAQTRTLLAGALLDRDDAVLTETAANQHLESRRTGSWFRLAIGATLPLAALAARILAVWISAQSGAPPSIAIGVAAAMLCLMVGLFMGIERPRRSWVVTADRAIWRPRAERLPVRVLFVACAAWVPTVGLASLGMELGLAGLWVLLAGLGLGLPVVVPVMLRLGVHGIEIDSQGIVLTGWDRRRIPWSEVVGVSHRQGLLPAVVVEVAGGDTHLLPVGGAVEDEIAEVVARIEGGMARQAPSGDAERREAARVTRLAARD